MKYKNPSLNREGFLWTVGVGGLEPPTSTSQTWRATNCATPRREMSIMRIMYRRQAGIPFAYIFTLAGLVFVLVACSAGPKPVVRLVVTSTPTKTALTTTPVPPSPVPVTPTPACQSKSGSLENRQLTTSYLSKPLQFIVYLPPCYQERTDLHYPVLYLFHGQFYDETQWVTLGAPEKADLLISTGEVSPFLMVFPSDPYPKQPYEYGFDEAFLKDLLPFINTQYRTLPDRTHTWVGGLSRGSSWALHFGLVHPDLFGKIGMHSPVIFASEGNLVDKWLDIIPPDHVPMFYLDISENDSNMQNALWLENLLTRRQLPHEWHLNPGFHNEDYWRAHVEDYLRWYAAGGDPTP